MSNISSELRFTCGGGAFLAFLAAALGMSSSELNAGLAAFFLTAAFLGMANSSSESLTTKSSSELCPLPPPMLSSSESSFRVDAFVAAARRAVFSLSIAKPIS